MNVTDDWISFGTSDYLVSRIPVRGGDAESHCQAHGEDTNLMIVNDLTEIKFIQSVIHQMIISDFIPDGIHTNFIISKENLSIALQKVLVDLY